MSRLLFWMTTLSVFSIIAVEAHASRPNVVVIVADDLGWGDVGYHNESVHTPHLNQLAKDGLRLERFYAYPTCSTTRSALMTGVATLRTSVNNRTGLPLSYRTLPQSFQKAGYQTWMFGKWHLGGSEDNVYSTEEFLPHKRGFDYFKGHLHGAIDYYKHVRKDLQKPDWQVNGVQVAEEGFSTDLLANAAIEKVHQRDADKPFFLYLPFNAVHGPLQAPPAGLERYADEASRKRQTLLANVTAMDEAIGRVLAAIDMAGERNETLVVFFSDNGGQLSQGASNGELRGEKGTVFEGGIRLPAVVRWPGNVPADQASNQLVWVADLFPTLTAAAAVNPDVDHEFDGVDLSAALFRNEQISRPLFVTGTADQAAFDGRWKLIASRGQSPMLFDIDADPYEKSDVASDHPDVVTQLTAAIDELNTAAPKQQGTGTKRSGGKNRGKKAEMRSADSEGTAKEGDSPAPKPNSNADSKKVGRPGREKKRNAESIGSENGKESTGKAQRAEMSDRRGPQSDFDEYAPTRSTKDEMVALASKGFAWLTGSPADNDVQSVGKDAQFFGFVRLRYNSDHSVQRGIIGRTFYGLLTPQQRDIVLDAAIAMQDDLQTYKASREQILRGLEDHLYTGRDFDAAQFGSLSDIYGEADAQLGLIQARAIAAVSRLMTPAERARLHVLRTSFENGKGLSEPEATQSRQAILNTDVSVFRLNKDERAYAEDLCAKAFTWLTGRPEDNETLPVGKPAQFFGFVSLRLKSQHAASRAGISRSFFDLLDESQQEILHQTVTEQHPLVDEYLAVRREFLRELEKLQYANDVNEERILELGARLGQLDVHIAQLQARTYASIRGGLTNSQETRMMTIRSQNVVESDELATMTMAERGERLSHLCASCHKPASAGTRIAPSLDGLFGRLAGSAEGFRYSPALSRLGDKGLRWDAESLNAFLKSPQQFAPGTAMGFKGLLHGDDRTALIDYLRLATD